MSAHLAVIEALMMLFVRELAPPARVLAAVRRYSKTEDAPAHSEEALLFWVNQSCQAVRYNYRIIDFNVDVIVWALAVSICREIIQIIGDFFSEFTSIVRVHGDLTIYLQYQLF
jgi:hypothetical protein